jgi:hypothetical protein
MTDRNLRVLVAVLIALLVVVVGATIVVVGGRNGRSPAASSPSPLAGESRAPSGSPSSSLATQPSSVPSAEPSAPATAPASSSPGASASPLPAPLASLTFVDLALDATTDPGGADRIVTFRSDGPGAIAAHLTSAAGQGKTHMCLRVGAKDLGCNDIASGTFTGKTSQAHATWQVTMRGTGAAVPVVNLTVTFQAVAPSVKIEHARFDGTDLAALNGIQARFAPRTAGNVHLVASWGGHPFIYEVDLVDETAGTGNATFPSQGPSTNVDQSIPVTPGDWRIVLKNSEAGFGITDLTAVVGWP